MCWFSQRVVAILGMMNQLLPHNFPKLKRSKAVHKISSLRTNALRHSFDLRYLIKLFERYEFFHGFYFCISLSCVWCFLLFDEAKYKEKRSEIGGSNYIKLGHFSSWLSRKILVRFRSTFLYSQGGPPLIWKHLEVY